MRRGLLVLWFFEPAGLAERECLFGSWTIGWCMVDLIERSHRLDTKFAFHNFINYFNII